MVVEGFNNLLTLAGPSASLALSGVLNAVEFERMVSFVMAGANNRAAGMRAGSVIVSKPDMALSGIENVFALGFDHLAMAQIACRGNKLIWTTAPGVMRPQISIVGENNMAENP